MARKYIQLGKSNSENVTAINDNFAELYEARTSIYDDVEQLQNDVAQLQSDMTAVHMWQSTVDNALYDTGWINLTLNTGWSMDDYESEFPQYRKIGNIVYLRGLLNATTAAGNIIGTLPSGFRPRGYFNRFVCSLNQSDNAVVQINANGQINDHQKGTKSRMFLSLNGISFPADY